MFKWADTGKCWYAFFVKTGDEARVKEKIEYTLSNTQDYDLFVPKRLVNERRAGKWRHVNRILFPGYILFYGKIGPKEYVKLKGIPGLFFVLKDRSCLYQINENEMDMILRLSHNSGTIGTSYGFIEGDDIIITKGPLVGYEAYIERIDKRKGRARVRMNFLGQLRLVDLDLSIAGAI